MIRRYPAGQQPTTPTTPASTGRPAWAATGDARGSAGLREYLKRFPLGRHAGEAQRLLSGAARPVTPAR